MPVTQHEVFEYENELELAYLRAMQLVKKLAENRMRGIAGLRDRRTVLSVIELLKEFENYFADHSFMEDDLQLDYEMLIGLFHKHRHLLEQYEGASFSKAYDSYVFCIRMIPFFVGWLREYHSCFHRSQIPDEILTLIQ